MGGFPFWQLAIGSQQFAGSGETRYGAGGVQDIPLISHLENSPLAFAPVCNNIDPRGFGAVTG